MDDQATVIGIDVGSVSVAVAEISLEHEVFRTSYRIHRGQEIETRAGVQVVSITYDGTTGNRNEAIIPYLALR